MNENRKASEVIDLFNSAFIMPDTTVFKVKRIMEAISAVQKGGLMSVVKGGNNNGKIDDSGRDHGESEAVSAAKKVR